MGQINQRKNAEVVLNNFGGGYAGAKAIGNLAANEAQDLDNIVILPSGAGFRNLAGTKQVTPTSGSSQNGWAFTLGVLATRVDLKGGGGATSQDLRIVTLSSLTSDNDDVNIIVHNTDAGTITSGGLVHFTNGTVDRNSIFSMFHFNGSIIITSRLAGTIDGGATTTPFKVGINNVTATSLQTGVAPQGRVGIGWNNRCWIGSTSAATSKLFYSALSNEGDWNGAGSGFVEPSPNEADELTALAPISNNVMLYFKQNSIYQVVGRSDPFAVFELFRGVGCVGNQALVTVDGIVYFITPRGQMRITDGSKVYDDRDIPELSNADNLWAQVPVSRRPFIRGERYKGTDCDWIIWLVSLGSGQTTNNYSIIWDLKNKCWLRCTQGFKANHITSAPEGRTFLGSYDSLRVFEVAVSGYYKDDTNSTPIYDGNNQLIAPTNSTTMAWKWRSDDYAVSLHNITQVQTINVLAKYGATGNLDANYRYDGKADSTDITKSLVPTSLTHNTAVYRPLGRGDTFGFELNSASEVTAQISRITLVGGQKGTKDPGVS